MGELIKLPEPRLLFKHNQAMEDPRDGLTLFGPLDEGKPYGVRAGIIGTKGGIHRFKKWATKIQYPISNSPPQYARPIFPGFEAVFRIPFNPDPAIELEVSEQTLAEAYLLDDRHQRVYKTVETYSTKIAKAINEEESDADIWFVVIPDEVYRYCRPKSYVEAELRITSSTKMKLKTARGLQVQRHIFPKVNEQAIPYQYEVDFRQQLKARLLDYHIPTQIVRESTIAHRDFVDNFGRSKRNLDDLQSAIAWHLSTATFYKTGGRPWKLGDIRPGVCYIGIVFKRDDKHSNPCNACCAAQMFLDSGDGIVFKGAVGPWYNQESGEFHLKQKDARELISIALESYTAKRGEPPKEIFLHGKVRFNVEEWKGFHEGIDPSTNLVGVRIRDEKDFKLYRKGKHPVLRGLAYIRDERTAYLWTKGFTPRLQTYPGRAVPKPLLIDVCRGDVDIKTVLSDVLALTKLNYNSCVFADGLPVTLRFADNIGEILTAGPLKIIPPLPFKFYI